MIRRLLGRHVDEKPMRMVDFLRESGAVIGENVDLIEFECSRKDAVNLQIGNNVTIVHSRILTHDASLRKFIGRNCNKIGRVVVGDNVFVGYGCVILPNVRIGDNVIIGAGAVVTHDIPANSVAAGNPARVIGTCDSYIQKHLERMKSPENVFWDSPRDKMNADERINFNREIDGRIVYLLSSDQPEIHYNPSGNLNNRL